MNTKLYFSPTCEVCIIDQLSVLCTSDRLGAETEVFDDLGTLELK